MAVTTTRQQAKEAAADMLGLFLTATVDAVSGTSVTITKLLDAAPDSDRMKNAFITKDGAVFRRITVGPDGSGVCTISQAISGLIADDTVGIYWLLNPEEWNNLVDEVLTSLYRVRRATITLVDETNEYALESVTTPTGDIQAQTQILGFVFRETSTSNILEEDAAAVRIIEDDNGITLHLTRLPEQGNANLSLEVVYRSYYSALATDSTTTNCPYPLFVRALEVAALHKLVKRYGNKGVKAMFGMEMVIAERELARLKNDLIAPFEALPYRMQDHWDGVDIPSDLINPSW
jgi:hypothetical protein